MTEEERRAAIAWVDDAISTNRGIWDDHKIFPIIKAMLAEPRLPAEPPPGAIKAMQGTFKLEDSYRALYAHLSVGQWAVWVSYELAPELRLRSYYDTEKEAEAVAGRYRDMHGVTAVEIRYGSKPKSRMAEAWYWEFYDATEEQPRIGIFFSKADADRAMKNGNPDLIFSRVTGPHQTQVLR